MERALHLHHLLVATDLVVVGKPVVAARQTVEPALRVEMEFVTAQIAVATVQLTVVLARQPVEMEFAKTSVLMFVTSASLTVVFVTLTGFKSEVLSMPRTAVEPLSLLDPTSLS